MRIKVYPKSPAPRHISQASEILKNNGLIILPTDSVYSFACSSQSPKALEKMAKLKNINPEKAHFSFIFSSISSMADYVKINNNDTFKLMNRLLPGPFTFILNANGKLQKLFPGKKTIGIRIPDNQIPLQIVEQIEAPLVVTSLHDDDAIIDYTTDPDLIDERWGKSIDLFIDGGFVHNEATTILDCTGDEIVLTRQGIGELEELID